MCKLRLVEKDIGQEIEFRGDLYVEFDRTVWFKLGNGENVRLDSE